MAGREYKARDKSVQKMSRDGLVEENLRTGKSQRAVTGRIDAVRIGDRPMEHFKAAGDLSEDGRLDRICRGGRHGLRKEDAVREAAEKEALMNGVPEEDSDASGHRNRVQRARESSFREAPSSLEENISRTASGELHGEKLGEHFADGTDGSGEGHFSEILQQDTYHTALRQRRGVQPEGYGASTSDFGSRPSSGAGGNGEGYGRNTRIRRRVQYVYHRRENGKSDEAYENRTQISVNPESGQENSTAAMQNDSPEGTGYPESSFENDLEERSLAEAHYHQQIRGHPASRAREAALYADELRQEGRKKRQDLHEKDSVRGSSRLRETSADIDGLDGIKEEIKSKRKRERLNQEQRKARDASRISFDDEGGMVKGSGMGFSRRAGTGSAGSSGVAKAAAGTAVGAAGKAAGMAAAFGKAKMAEAASEDDNPGMQSAMHAESIAENSARSLASRGARISERKGSASRRKGSGRGSARLLFTEEEDLKSAAGKAKTEKEKKAAVKRFFKKQRQRRMIAAARKEEKTIVSVLRGQQSAISRAATIVRDAVVRSRGALIVIGAVFAVFLLISASLGSCGALVQGIGNSVISTTYPSTDEDIYAVENRYRELEAGLDSQIRRMQETHPTYDEFRFQIDEITHNPYHLISYFTSKYGQFTYEQVKDELEEIFREQYTLTTSGERGVTITETRTVHPGESLGEVTTSGYCSCEICCGPWAGGTTASGVYPMSNHTLAVDAYNPFVPIGTHVIMNGIEYVVEDTGAFDRFGVQFDVYYDDHQSALAHGHQVCEAILADGGGVEELELTTTRTVDRMSVVLTNHDLDTVLQNRMTAEEKVRYSLYNITFGNRNYLFDLNNLPKYGNASRDYTIPPEALSDERFARMIAEAERHLGTPYVWGGYAPGGFDCSGFVCWVINHCGNGWSIGRTTAEGIRQYCTYVSPEDARPGDIIFFENTYSCAGASHVGIYVGDGMMIHCGEPVQYTSINTSYWQDHFMEFGRIP